MRRAAWARATRAATGLVVWAMLAVVPLSAAGQEAEPDEAEVETTYRAIAVVAPRAPNAATATAPQNVQRIETSRPGAEHPLGVHDALDARSASVSTSDAQGNPLQPDVSYRGFVASPVLGMPQGVAVYQNDVRINEAFGDVVLWDLLPEVAIADVQLAPAGDARHGRGALGGALVLRTKTAWDVDKTRVSALGGSFARYHVEAESGRVHDGHWGAYAAASIFGERGYRDESSSNAQRFYTDLRRRAGATDVGMQVTLAASDLHGNGPTPVDVLRSEGRSALYTFPDQAKSSLVMVAADAEHAITRDFALVGNAYLRYLGRDTVNGDEAEFLQCSDGTRLCDEDEEPIHSEDGGFITAAATAYDALYNSTATDTYGYGARAALRSSALLARHDNRFELGATYDGAEIAYLQRAELGRLTTVRSVTPRGIFLAGDELRTKLDARNHAFGAYATDTLALSPQVAISLGARLDLTRVELDDREGSALDGKHTFVRVNPALGVTYAPLRALTWFASYAESNRVPSAAELACADPSAPCRLPNAFVADPPLRQVVARSVELGARGQLGRSRDTATLRWSIAGFGARNQDDILFVAGSRVGTGYFRNAGATQRLGVEADVSTQVGILGMFASYTLLRATFESTLRLPSEAHPDARGGVITVRPGDRISGLPAHAAKAGVTLQATKRWSSSVSTAAYGDRRLRGDEAGLLDTIDAYATLQAETSYELIDGVSLFAKGDNLLDAEYETFGVVADPGEVIASASDPRFVTPGAPLSVWIGITLREP